jgi:hypothetical protein
MHIINVNRIEEGACVTARPIFGTFGHLMIEQGVILTESHLDELRRLHIQKAVVSDATTTDIPFEQLIDSENWIRWIKSIRRVYHQTQEGAFAEGELLMTAYEIICFSKKEPHAIPIPSVSVPLAMQSYAHVVNVSLWAARIGEKLAYSAEAITNLVVGCLLHDIGKIRTGNQADYAERGYLLIQPFLSSHPTAAQIVREHPYHSGSQWSFQYSPPCEAAKVCGMCCMLENFSNTCDSMHSGALDILQSLQGSLFSQREIEALTATVPRFLPGTVVRVHNGGKAVVTLLTDCPDKPVLRFLSTGQMLYLEEYDDLMIDYVQR